MFSWFNREHVPNPVTELVLLQELFGQVLEVALREGDVRSDGEFVGVACVEVSFKCGFNGIVKHTITGDFDGFAELASLALDLYAVVEELLEISTIEDTVASGLRVVDDKLVLGGDFGGGGFGLYTRQNKGGRGEPTEKITQQSSAGTDHLEGGRSLEAFGDVDDGV